LLLQTNQRSYALTFSRDVYTGIIQLLCKLLLMSIAKLGDTLIEFVSILLLQDRFEFCLQLLRVEVGSLCCAIEFELQLFI